MAGLLDYRQRIENIMSIRCPRTKKKDKVTPWRLMDQQETKYSIDFAYHIPNGYSYLDIEKQVDAISAAIGSHIDVINRGGVVVISIPTQDFPNEIHFTPDMLNTVNDRKVLLGFTRTMKEVIHDFSVPHLLIAGMSGYGKTDLIRLLIYQLITRFTPEQLEIQIIDMKGFSFLPFRNIPHITQIARTLTEAQEVLKWGYDLMNERSNDVWEEGERSKTKSFKWSIVLIDEASQIAPDLKRDKEKKKIAAECDEFASAISCIGREASVGLIYCTQRPDSKVINPQVKANMDVSICFRTKTSSNSEVVIDRSGAEKLPQGTPGRCIYSATQDIILQVPYVGNDAAWEKLLAPFKKGVCHDEKARESESYSELVEDNPDYRFNFGREVLSWRGFPKEASIRDIKIARATKTD